MEDLLNEVEIRVLGCLMEKEMATPDYYPLSLNALLNACNQKSNRVPVVAYDEATVEEAISSLSEKKMVWRSDAGRVFKYNESFVKNNNLLTKEAALLCLLCVRGPQTVGELRGRAERLYSFDDLAEVERSLENLAEMDMVTKLAKQPGRKESRFAHLLAGEPQEEADLPANTQAPAIQPRHDRLTELEEEVAVLRGELEDIRREFAKFKSQFE